MIDKTVPTPAAAVAGIHDGATVMIGGFGTAGMPSELIDALIEQGARELTIVNNNAGNGDTGLAALLKAQARAQDRLLVSAADRFVRIRRAVSRRRDRARAGAAGQPRRAHPRGRRRHRRVLHADRLRHAAGRGQGNARHRRPQLRARVPDPRRLRADQGRPRRPLGQPRLPQDRAQLRPDHGQRGAMHDRAGARSRAAGRARSRKHIVTPGIFVQRVVRDRRAVAASRRRPPRDAETDDETLHPRPDGRPRRARHPRRRVREPRHRPAHAGRQSPAEGPRDLPAQRERPARHGARAGARAGGRATSSTPASSR